MAGLEIIFLGTRIAEIGACGEIIFRQSKVGFIGCFVGKSELQFEQMVESFLFIGLCGDFGNEVVALESRAFVGLIFAEAVRLIAQIFHQKAQILGAIAYAGIRLEGVVAAIGGVQLSTEL